MTYDVFVLYKRGEPIAQGSMEHCLDVYYWERVHGYSNKGYELLPIEYEQEEQL